MSLSRPTVVALATTAALVGMNGQALALEAGVATATRVAEVCTGEFAEIQLHNDSTRDYIHYGGVQQCTPAPVHQTLTIMLFRIDGSHRTLVDQRSRIAVDWTLTVWGEPFCDSHHSTTYQMAAQGSADGVHSNPWPVAWSKRYTLNCWIDEPATPATATS